MINQVGKHGKLRGLVLEFVRRENVGSRACKGDGRGSMVVAGELVEGSVSRMIRMWVKLTGVEEEM